MERVAESKEKGTHERCTLQNGIWRKLRNTHEGLWLDNEEAEGWKAADQAKEEWDAAEKEKNRNRGQVGEEQYEIKEIPTEKLKAVYDETTRKVREHNRQAKLENPIWEIAQRTQNNDSAYEDKELRFKERDEKSRRDDNRDTRLVSKREKRSGARRAARVHRETLQKLVE
jgi:hypothetical protein